MIDPFTTNEVVPLINLKQNGHLKLKHKEELDIYKK